MANIMLLLCVFFIINLARHREMWAYIALTIINGTLSDPRTEI